MCSDADCGAVLLIAGLLFLAAGVVVAAIGSVVSVQLLGPRTPRAMILPFFAALVLGPIGFFASGGYHLAFVAGAGFGAAMLTAFVQRLGDATLSLRRRALVEWAILGGLAGLGAGGAIGVVVLVLAGRGEIGGVAAVVGLLAGIVAGARRGSAGVPIVPAAPQG